MTSTGQRCKQACCVCELPIRCRVASQVMICQTKLRTQGLMVNDVLCVQESIAQATIRALRKKLSDWNEEHTKVWEERNEQFRGYVRNLTNKKVSAIMSPGISWSVGMLSCVQSWCCALCAKLQFTCIASLLPNYCLQMHQFPVHHRHNTTEF